MPSTFFLTLRSSLEPIQYDAKSTLSPGKPLSQLASIDSSYPPPLPSPIKNGAIFSSATWSSSLQSLPVPRLENVPVACLGHQLMTYSSTQLWRLALHPFMI